jgi:hypothetical protein
MLPIKKLKSNKSYSLHKIIEEEKKVSSGRIQSF